MDVEQLAVNRISDLISRCPRLKANIAHNDKTPFTDGHIDLYARPGHQSKKEFRGRVPVQVKGRTGLPKRGTRPSFSISRTDLEGYLRDRGVLYFVVYVDPKSRRRRAYYVTLSPFKIDELLRESSAQAASVSVKLSRLPADPEKLEAVLAFAYQSRSEDLDLRASEALWGNVSAITVHAASELDLAKPLKLKHSELDFSVTITTADGTRAPADGMFMLAPEEYVGVQTEHVIRSGDFAFRNPIRRRISEDTVELELSPGVRVSLRDPKKGGGGTVSLDMQSNLGQRISDVGFFLTCMHEAGFSLNNGRLQFEGPKAENFADLRAHFSDLMKIQEVFEHLAADAGLVDLQAVTQKQMNQLVALHSALVKQEEVTQDFERPGRVLQPVGEWSIELLCIRGEQAGKWRYLNLFGAENRYQFAAEKEGASQGSRFFRITPYEVIDDDRFPFTLNLRLESVVDAFEEVAEYPGVTSRATEVVLRLIAAADAVSTRRVEFLDTAGQLNDWIISKDSIQPPYLINRWQILARTNGLSAEDRAAIRDLRRLANSGNIEAPELIEVSCAILLGDPEDVAYGLSRLESTELDWLKTWPIWALHESGLPDLSTSVDRSDAAWPATALTRLLRNE